MAHNPPTGVRSAVVFAGGEATPPRHVERTARELAARRATGAVFVAADSGLHHALVLGSPVDLVVGDLDSAHPEAVAAAVAGGARVERHPADKDATDLELAIETARALGARELLVVGGHGGRLDHLLANVLLLAAPAWADLEIEALLGESRVTVVRGHRTLHGTPGDLVTLLPVGGPALGVRTRGLRWALADEELGPGSTRGVSNRLVAAEAEVWVRGGVLAAVVSPDR